MVKNVSNDLMVFLENLMNVGNTALAEIACLIIQIQYVEGENDE
jgi:hypothetical protein